MSLPARTAVALAIGSLLIAACTRKYEEVDLGSLSTPATQHSPAVVLLAARNSAWRMQAQVPAHASKGELRIVLTNRSRQSIVVQFPSGGGEAIHLAPQAELVIFEGAVQQLQAASTRGALPSLSSSEPIEVEIEFVVAAPVDANIRIFAYVSDAL